MNESTPQPPKPRSLYEAFESDSKRFEWVAKQYYDLFAYHAAQRLTAFNFFLVSLSFFSTAYATLLSKSGASDTKLYNVAAVLAFAAYLLVIAFGRLDKRNEQIIRINEKPLIRIQRAIRLGLDPSGEDGEEVWETFIQADRSYRFRTFSFLLPAIYCLSAAACAAGGLFGITGPGETLDLSYCAGWLFLVVFSSSAICFPFSRQRKATSALAEAEKVRRPRPEYTKT